MYKTNSQHELFDIFIGFIERKKEASRICQNQSLMFTQNYALCGPGLHLSRLTATKNADFFFFLKNITKGFFVEKCEENLTLNQKGYFLS